MEVVFWGVRGSLPVCSKDTVLYGGNTACVELRLGNRILIFDAGSGLFRLGQALKSFQGSLDVFLSHLHWDHLMGFPFFAPLGKKENRIRLYGPAHQSRGLANPLESIIVPPWFPVSMEALQAEILFTSIGPNQNVDLGDGILIKVIRLNHPGMCLGFRIEYGAKSVCYLSDNEPSSAYTPILRDFVRKTQLLILDAQYTEEEYYGAENERSKVGWGHSTFEQSLSLGYEAEVERLALFHHDPERTDEELRKKEAELLQTRKGVFVAKEGMVISL